MSSENDVGAMSAGPALDALVAERVMGYRLLKHPRPDWWIFTYRDEDGFDVQVYVGSRGHGVYVWRPSEDIAAAWQVRDKIASERFSIRQEFNRRVRFLVGYRLGIPAMDASEVLLRVTPRDICVAALRATIAPAGGTEGEDTKP